MDYLQIIKRIAEKSDTDWIKVHEIICEALNRLKSMDLASYSKTIDCLEDIAYTIPQDKAQEIVRSMKPYGECWEVESVKKFIEGRNIDWSIDWYLVMNMVYNDYHDTAEMVNMAEDSEFYFSLARDFIQDEDAKRHKVEKYFS